MIQTKKLWILSALTLVAVIFVFFMHPIPQSLSFHHFADCRPGWGIPNIANVISNLPFVFIGIHGLVLLKKSSVPKAVFYTYFILFTGVVLTGLGSAYYHSRPDNDSLVWDRIPMTIVFMAVLSATVAASISRSLGARLLLPLVVLGVFSVIWWHYTEGTGRGDLRLFYLLQFYPMLMIPMVLALYYHPARKPIALSLGWVVFWYAIAKIFEQLDKPFYVALGVSGHTLKHLAAAVSTWHFVILFKQQYFFKFSDKAPNI